jgi:hypothetical protein
MCRRERRAAAFGRVYQAAFVCIDHRMEVETCQGLANQTSG